jgi:hypothetical protein
MFENLIKQIEEKEGLGKITCHNIREIVSYYNSITSEAQEIFSAIKEKFNFENRNLVFPYQENDTHLEFWRGSGGYNVRVSLADKTGTYDYDKDFGIIIHEWPFENILSNDDEIDQQKYFKVVDNIFYSWMSFNWQTVCGYETQLSVKIIENNSASIFSLNDFAWYDLSNFITFRDIVEPRERYFNRDLGLAEIYSRADLKFNFSEIPVYERRFAKNELTKTISLRQGNIFVNNAQISRGHSSSVDNYFDRKEIQVLFVKTINESLNNDWIDITLQSA